MILLERYLFLLVYKSLFSFLRYEEVMYINILDVWYEEMFISGKSELILNFVCFFRVQIWQLGKMTIYKVSIINFWSWVIFNSISGTGCEMYTETLSPSFAGMSFSQAAEYENVFLSYKPSNLSFLQIMLYQIEAAVVGHWGEEWRGRRGPQDLYQPSHGQNSCKFHRILHNSISRGS